MKALKISQNVKMSTRISIALIITKVYFQKSAAFVWSSEQGHHGHNVSGISGGANKCNSGQGVSSSGTGGGQPQGLVHWMSVMAEHMNNAASTPHHHDPVHYMWNGVSDVSWRIFARNFPLHNDQSLMYCFFGRLNKKSTLVMQKIVTIYLTRIGYRW